MSTKDMVRINLSLNRIVNALDEGLIRSEDVMENHGFRLLLFSIYKSKHLPEKFTAIIYDIRKAFMNGLMSYETTAKGLKPLLDEIHRRQREG